MPFNTQILVNLLTVGLTSSFASLLTYLAAWSKFSSEVNNGLAAIIAAFVATAIGAAVTMFINKNSWLLNAVAPATGSTQVVVHDQKIADQLPKNPNIFGPTEAKIIKE